MKIPQSSNTLPSTVQAESCLEPLAPSMSLSVQAPSWHPMSLCPLAVSVSCLRLRLLPRAQPTAAHQALNIILNNGNSDVQAHPSCWAEILLVWPASLDWH